jgi:hypothetical protein
MDLDGSGWIYNDFFSLATIFVEFIQYYANLINKIYLIKLSLELKQLAKQKRDLCE